MYPVVFFDAPAVKVRDEATVRSKAVYLALAVRPTAPATSWASGSSNRGAKFWLRVFSDLRRGGVRTS